MDNLSVFKYVDNKPGLFLRLNISDGTKCWVLPETKRVKSSGKRIAFEIRDENYIDSNKLEPIDKGELKVHYFKKKKIKFTAVGKGEFSGEYIFYIPSWGLNTRNKIWVLIPSSKM